MNSDIKEHDEQATQHGFIRPEVPIKLNKTYLHNKTQKKYYVQDLCNLKVGGAWVECAVYASQNGEKFVRKVDDFRKNFSEY